MIRAVAHAAGWIDADNLGDCDVLCQLKDAAYGVLTSDVGCSWKDKWIACDLSRTLSQYPSPCSEREWASDVAAIKQIHKNANKVSPRTGDLALRALAVHLGRDIVVLRQDSEAASSRFASHYHKESELTVHWCDDVVGDSCPGFVCDVKHESTSFEETRSFIEDSKNPIVIVHESTMPIEVSTSVPSDVLGSSSSTVREAEAAEAAPSNTTAEVAAVASAAVCEVEGCTKAARGSTAYCLAHGGGKRCEVEGYNKETLVWHLPPCLPEFNFCLKYQ